MFDKRGRSRQSPANPAVTGRLAADLGRGLCAGFAQPDDALSSWRSVRGPPPARNIRNSQPETNFSLETFGFVSRLTAGSSAKPESGRRQRRPAGVGR